MSFFLSDYSKLPPEFEGKERCSHCEKVRNPHYVAFVNWKEIVMFCSPQCMRKYGKEKVETWHYVSPKCCNCSKTPELGRNIRDLIVVHPRFANTIEYAMCSHKCASQFAKRNNIVRKCFGCKKTDSEGKLKWCEGCHIYYCSAECQKKTWKEHAKICKEDSKITKSMIADAEKHEKIVDELVNRVTEKLGSEARAKIDSVETITEKREMALQLLDESIESRRAENEAFIAEEVAKPSKYKEFKDNEENKKKMAELADYVLETLGSKARAKIDAAETITKKREMALRLLHAANERKKAEAAAKEALAKADLD